MRREQRFCSACGAPAIVPVSTAAQGRGADADLPEDRRLVTVLFARIANIVELGQRLDAEPMRHLVASVEDAVARQVDDDAERAIRAALGVHVAIAQLNGEVANRYGVRVGLGIGLDTGEVVAGALASSTQSVYTVVGDTVNVARALASAAQPGDVVVGALTQRLTQRTFEAENLTSLSLNDRSQPIPAHRILRPRALPAIHESTAMVGRAGELAYLRRAYDHIHRGRGLSIVILGEAGIGKSRLIREFQTHVEATVPQIAARCASFDSDTPYALVAGLLRAAFQIESGADESTVRGTLAHGLSALDYLAPEPQLMLLVNVLGYGDQFPFNPESRRPILLMILRLIFEHASAEAPLVVIIEDLHWADAASIAIVSDLANEIVGRTCLFVGTARSGWNPPWPAEKLELHPLHEDDARVLIGRLLHSVPDDALVSAILQRTGGNPFFVEEVAHDVAGAHVNAGVPASVQEVIQARLDRLPPEIKNVVHTAAVCGTTFAYQLVEQLVSPQALAGSLDVLERERFIVPATKAGERLYAFRHALIQEVAYRVQLKSQLRRAHEGVGRAIEKLYANRLDEFVSDLAFHYARSSDDAKALHWLVRAGDRARALFANAEALSMYTTALERAPGAARSPDAIAILERMSDVHILTGKYDEAIARLHAALARAPGRQGSLAARLWRKIGTSLAHKGAYSEALSAFEKAIGEVGEADDVETARIRAQVGYVHFRRGDYDRAKTALVEVVDIGTRVSADDVVVEALKYLGNIAVATGELRAAADFYQRCQDHFERLEDVLGLADMHNNLAIIYRRAGRWDDALAECNSALSLRKRMGNPLGIGLTLNNIGEIYRTRGEPAPALAFYESALDIFGSIGDRLFAALALVGRGAAHIELGNIDQGRSDLLDAQARFAAIGSTLYHPDLYRYLAAVDLASGNLGGAEDAAEASLQYARAAGARDQEAIAQRVLGQLSHVRGQYNRAHELLETSRRTLADIGYAAELARTEAALAALAAERSAATESIADTQA